MLLIPALLVFGDILLVNNLATNATGNPTSYTTSWGIGKGAAQAFKATSTGFLITKINLNLFSYADTTEYQFYIKLYKATNMFFSDFSPTRLTEVWSSNAINKSTLPLRNINNSVEVNPNISLDIGSPYLAAVIMQEKNPPEVYGVNWTYGPNVNSVAVPDFWAPWSLAKQDNGYWIPIKTENENGLGINVYATVPEPNSLLLGLIATAFGAGAYRHHRRKKLSKGTCKETKPNNK